MTTPGIERELTAVLQRHAEAAMSRTDTQAELKEFHDRVGGGAPRTGRGRVVTGAALAAAAAVVLGVAWFADVTGGGADQEPAQDPSGQTADERVAQQFVEALAVGDLARPLLAEGASLPVDLEIQFDRNEAWSIEHDVQRCDAIRGTDFGTTVVCPFDYHAYRSEELGLGPFGNNSVTLVLDDGKVRSFQTAYNWRGNGDHELYGQIEAWMRENHSGEWKFLDSPDVRPAEMPRWIRLWQQRTQQYADAMTAG
jgi:hypothetical protein